MEHFVCLTLFVLAVPVTVLFFKLAQGASRVGRMFGNWQELISACRDTRDRNERVLLVIALLAQVLCRSGAWTVAGAGIAGAWGTAAAACDLTPWSVLRGMLQDLYEFIRGLLRVEPSK